MTEEEAKTKWCPIVRIAHENVVANRTDGYGSNDVYKTQCCIASECMMWRWGKIPHCFVNGVERENYPSSEKGYCGLGGDS